MNEISIAEEVDGKPVIQYLLEVEGIMTMKVFNYGGIIQSLSLPDKNGNFQDVVLGFDKIADYQDRSPYFGCIVGRYGNRIANATFELDDKKYTLSANDNGNQLHGGISGFDKKMWEGQLEMVDGNPSLLLSYLSPDGEEHYPGNLQAFVRYTLTREAELIIDYKATSDKTTIYNPTNHSYFNLQGHGAGKILQHQIQINADHFTPVDKKLIPLGHLLAVDGTAMDLRKQKSIEDGIDDKFSQIQLGGGYDHNWVLNKTTSSEWSKAAEVFEPSSGRVMEVFTTEPGIQFYSGNFLSEMTGKQGKTYLHRGGFCLETQHFPDSPNQKSFPTTVLRPDEEFSSRTMYKFSTR